MNDPFAIIDQTKPGLYRVEMNLLSHDNITVSVETDVLGVFGPAAHDFMGFHLVLKDHPVALQGEALDAEYKAWQTEQLILVHIDVATLRNDFPGAWCAVHEGMLDWAATAESERIEAVFPRTEEFLQGLINTRPVATADEGIALLVSLYLWGLAQECRPTDLDAGLERLATSFEDAIKLNVFEATGCWL